MDEMWRPIPGYDGFYEISNFGEVRSWRRGGGNHEPDRRAEEPHLIAPHYRIRPGKKNSLEIALYSDGRKGRPIPVKNLMRDIWMKGTIPGMYVTFVDGDAKNCALHNLRYADQREASKTRTLGQRKPVLKCTADGEVIRIYKSAVEAAKKEFLTASGIRNRIRRKAVIDGVYFKHDR